MLIIRRINSNNTTSGICHLHIVTYKIPEVVSIILILLILGPENETATDTMAYTRCCIDIIDSPDDEHGVARNM